MAVLKGIKPCTRIYFNLTDSFCYEAHPHRINLRYPYRGLDCNTEVVLGIVSLGEVGACLGTTGADEIPFQQDLPGEVRMFHIASHQ
eukprot:15295110-Heterocapsa_arctica.AAC.1